MSTAERLVGVVFVLTAAAWIVRPLIESFVPGIARLAGAGAADRLPRPAFPPDRCSRFP
ncbi:MAG TPA: hypothetical protein VK943_12955 [Arenibaculum sp.]|nr:hypothetical protein [Arenibaculum sp.]